MNASIIGQHLALNQILQVISEASHRNQVLVFGLIGSPGTGKSLLSQLLVQTFMQQRPNRPSIKESEAGRPEVREIGSSEHEL